MQELNKFLINFVTFTNIVRIPIINQNKQSMASALMNQYRDDYNKDKYQFYYGQYLAYTEIYSMLNNIQN